MSQTNRTDPRSSSAWRLYPWFLAGGLGFVMVVNVAMSWTAVRSFPGLATTHGFDDSNGYDRVLVAAGRQAALGWTVRDTLQANRPVILLTGRAGAPLAGAKLAATIERPIGEADPVPVAFHAAGPGRFEADAALPPGAWDIDLTVTAEGGVFHTTRRLIAR